MCTNIINCTRNLRVRRIVISFSAIAAAPFRIEILITTLIEKTVLICISRAIFYVVLCTGLSSTVVPNTVIKTTCIGAVNVSFAISLNHNTFASIHCSNYRALCKDVSASPGNGRRWLVISVIHIPDTIITIIINL